ncbi:hypothetical protein ACFL27_27720, partial [candidate division CSSED10-310 bacterium]
MSKLKSILVISGIFSILIIITLFILHHLGIDLFLFKRSPKLTRTILDQSLELGTQFLVNNQKPGGNFNYEYDFVARKLDQGDSQVRQAGALWGLSLIYQDNPSATLLPAVLKGFEFFRTHSVAPEDGRRWIAYPNNHSGRTGTAALVALSYIDFLRSEHTLESDVQRQMKAELDQLLSFLVSLRIDNGQFHASYNLHSGKGFGSPSPYFDGETLLALVKAAKYLGKGELEPLIIQSARTMHQVNIVAALQQDPDSKISKGFYQWGSMSYFEIATSGWENTTFFGDVVIELADWMIDVHHTLWRTRNTAYAYEGIIHAFELARTRNDAAHTAKFAAVIDRGLSKLISWQVGGPLQNRYLRQRHITDKLAVGGVMNHRKEPLLRIDVTQHQMHAIILARKYVYLKTPSLSLKIVDKPHHSEQSEVTKCSILFLGDTSFGENYQERRGSRNILTAKGYEYPLQNYSSFL